MTTKIFWGANWTAYKLVGCKLQILHKSLAEWHSSSRLWYPSLALLPFARPLAFCAYLFRDPPAEAQRCIGSQERREEDATPCAADDIASVVHGAEFGPLQHHNSCLWFCLLQSLLGTPGMLLSFCLFFF